MICVTPIRLKNETTANTKKWHDVPCGKCGSCLHNRRVDWSFRLKWELKGSVNAFFVTLTYANENLRFRNGYATLHKPDFQNFMKRLRKEQALITDMKIRYYCVGEYGGQTYRPHYHALLFNVNLNVLEKIETIWNLGTVHVGSVDDGSIHYVTKYHMNPNAKEIVDDKTGEIIDLQPEFALMSRKPGIGFNYVENNTDYHKNNLNTYVINNGYKQRFPRYLRDKIYNEHEKNKAYENMQDVIDTLYNDEVKRLERLGEKDPTRTYDVNDYNKASSIVRKSKFNKGSF